MNYERSAKAGVFYSPMITLRAPAKINLYLRVISKRADGYHELETLFERISLADELVFESSSDGRLTLTCTEPSLSCGEENLILKAARLLRQISDCAAGASIHLIKHIPIAAGLGGGSSDAAAALRGLNELWRLQLNQQQLIELGASLGSDVPFFLSDAPFAIGRGRGECCKPLTVGRHQRLIHVLVVPQAHLSTKEIYTTAEFDLTALKPSISMVSHAFSNGSLGELAKGLWNDLEPEAIRRCPVISVIQSCLRASGCLGVRVSGSGPSVYGLCRDAAHADKVVAQLQQHPECSWRIQVIETESSSPTIMRRTLSGVKPLVVA